MTQAQTVDTKAPAKPKPPKRRLWQHLFRWGLIFVLLLTGAYITLPWWLPTNLLRNYLVADLSRQAGSGVSIGSITASWGDGLQIRDIVFDSPAGFEPDPLLKISSLRADFSPLSFLLAHKLDFVEVEDPHLRLQVNAAGHNNAEGLGRLQNDVAIRRISIRQAAVDIQLPGEAKVLRLEVGDLQMLSGRLSRLSRLTMSAALRQESTPAPLSLRLWAEPSAQTAADASFNFTNVQLAQLPLAKLLGLPLTKLGGTCSGRLDLKVNDQGVVDHFELGLLVRQLDLESASNFDLAPMDEARLDVAATLDPLSDQVDLKSVQVHVPGVDLAGKAMLTVGLDASSAGGTPTLIQTIDLEGKIDPSALAAMLLGHPAIKGELQVEGPLELAFHAHRQEQSLRLDLSADATAATIRKGSAILKPDTRRLRYELAGVIDDRGWKLSADRTTLILGDNQFAGRGSVREVAQLLETYFGDEPPTMQQMMSDVSRLAWNGTCQISDLKSITDACPAIEPLLGQMTLHGTASGSFDLDHTNGSQVGLRLTIPADAQLTVGTFVKPHGKAMDIALRGTLDAKAMSLSDVLFEAGIGRSYVRAEKGRLLLRAGEGTPTSAPSTQPSPWPLGLQAGGSFAAVGVAELLEGLPIQQRPAIRGEVLGDYVLQFDGRQMRAHLRADLGKADIDARPYFVKAASQLASADLDYYFDAQSSDVNRSRLALDIHLPVGDFAARVACGQQGQYRLSGRAAIRDASLLAATVPLLGAPLDGATLGGTLSADFLINTNAHGTPSVGPTTDDDAPATFAINIHAGGLTITPAPNGRAPSSPASFASRRKAAGTPLELRLAGEARQAADDAQDIRVTALTANVAGTTLTGSAQTLLRRQGAPGAPQFDLQTLALDGLVTCNLGTGLYDLVPELVPLVRTYALAGQATINSHLTYGPQGFALTADVNADQLALGSVGPVTKAAGVPLSGTARLHLSPKFTELRAEVAARAGTTLANASATFDNTATGWPFRPHLASANVTVACTDAANLATLLPALAQYKLAGSVKVGIDLANTNTLLVKSLRMDARKLTGLYADKPCLLSGDLLIENLDLATPGAPRIGRVAAEELEIALGKNHLWLLTDVQNLPYGPKGSVQVLAQYLDDQDIAGFLAKLPSTPQQSNTPTPRPEERAAAVLAAMRQALTDARITLSVSADALRYRDSNVNQSYTTRKFQLDSRIEQGHLELDYQAGLNGGLVTNHYEVNLNDPAPLVTQDFNIREVQADASIQPQLSMFFPGNTVNGLFSRESHLSAAMKDFLAAVIDSRYPLHWTGSARTVATKGFVEGRSAPQFITQVFPGLNLTRYDYTTMTGYAEFLNDGSVRNDMLFDGSYNVYMDGVTGPDHIGEYEIGVCLAPASAQWNHTWKQGRIPILKWRGKIQGGKIIDQEVSYFWPNETLFKVFLQRNAIYRAWQMRQGN